MRAVLQRVTRARVSVGGETVGEIGAGLLILVCAMGDDVPDAPERMAAKIAKMRICRDAADKMNLSLRDTGGRRWSSASSRSRPICAATAPAFPPPPPPRSRRNPATGSWPRCAPTGSRSRPGASAPTCRWTS